MLFHHLERFNIIISYSINYTYLFTALLIYFLINGYLFIYS